MRIAHLLLMLWLVGNGAFACASAVVARDDSSNTITLKQPAKRIVSLSPHITELLFAVGAGDRVVAVVEYSDYPPAAKSLPLIGSASSLDIERIARLQPDLIVAWGSGNPKRQLELIRRLNIPLFVSEPKTLADIAATLRRIGKLAGTDIEAERAVSNFDQRLAELRGRYSGRPNVTVFHEVWNQPLMTIGGKHVINQIIELCGGRNVFAAATLLAPTIDTEAVLRFNPEVIVASGMDDKRPAWLDDWKKWPTLHATAAGNLDYIPPDLLHRQTPRILDGAQRMCEVLDAARAKRKLTPQK